MKKSYNNRKIFCIVLSSIIILTITITFINYLRNRKQPCVEIPSKAAQLRKAIEVYVLESQDMYLTFEEKNDRKCRFINNKTSGKNYI